MAKHTQGPWHVAKIASPNYAPEFGIYGERAPNDLARVMGPNASDNAQLIAAAPLMLKALEVIEEFLSEHPEFKQGNSKVHYCTHLARSAIAETKGD